jgi:hypothetical protein
MATPAGGDTLNHDDDVVAPQASTPVPALPISTTCGVAVPSSLTIIETFVC